MILLLKISQWLSVSLRVIPQFIEWSAGLCGLPSILPPPTPYACSLYDLSLTTLTFVPSSGLLAFPWKYRACAYVRAFALAILFLRNFFLHMPVWVVSHFFQAYVQMLERLLCRIPSPTLTTLSSSLTLLYVSLSLYIYIYLYINIHTHTLVIHTHTHTCLFSICHFSFK